MNDWNRSLGFACKVEGKKGLSAEDGRRPQNNPHLRHSLEGLSEVLDYLRQTDIRVFRLPSGIVPYATHPDHPRLHWKKQMREARSEIEAIKQKLRDYPVRLSFHPSQFVLLNSPRKEVVKKSLEELLWQCHFLDLLEAGEEARVLLHVGGVYDDREGASERMKREMELLPDDIRRRFALENDDRLWNAREVQNFCREGGVPMIFDIHHHALHGDGRSWQSALRGALATWPKATRPKIHFSSPLLQAEKTLNLRAHADYIDPWSFARFRKTIDEGRFKEFDVMLEAKKKDLAVLALRDSLSLKGTENA